MPRKINLGCGMGSLSKCHPLLPVFQSGFSIGKPLVLIPQTEFGYHPLYN